MAGTRSRLHKQVAETSRRATRRGRASEYAGVPDVFQDMLVDEQASDRPSQDEEGKSSRKGKIARNTKKRSISPVPETQLVKRPKVDSTLQSQQRLSPRIPLQSQAPVVQAHADEADDHISRGQILQTIEDSDESGDSDLEWEDALGDGNEDGERDSGGDIEPEIGDISITIGPHQDNETKAKKQIRRRAITSVDKKRRLDIHKMHVLCLLYHVHRRNTWCNDGKVHVTLRRLPPPKTLSLLVPNPDFSQFQASKQFLEGMGQLKLLWSQRFTVTRQGMYKPRWAEADAEVRPCSEFDELDDPMDRGDFRKAASSLQGSQDVGAQLFCALLRSIGVEARLVCSLQCLPFASAAQPSTPQKQGSQQNTITIDPYNRGGEASSSKPKPPVRARPQKRWSRLEQVLGEQIRKAGVSPKQQKKYYNPYPVYWVEVLNPAHQKWIPIDPLSTSTVNAPEKLEPPLNFSQNSLLYVVAFEEDYAAMDVTRRYAKAYNAKTRKFRVESTPDGDRWWKRALKIFKRSTRLDRDQVEKAFLARKEATEGIPKNVQDFKNHPIYVLERHLKHNEVIHPMNQVGKVNVGTSMNPKMEPIYRRKNVHIVRSADKWYRLGRDVKDGEQPLKHAKPRKGGRRSMPPDMDQDDQQEEIGAGLYAFFQTNLYVPPPVVRGRIPRNAYGNLDLYVPSMVPEGGVHIRHKLAAKAARLIGVDYVDAVTGFSFKGRHGTAVVQGVVVAEEYAKAVEAVLDAMEYAQEEAEIAVKRSEALRMWRRFYPGLRIAQRVNAIEIDGETGPVVDVQNEIEREDKKLAEKGFAGGFFPDEGNLAELVAPTAHLYEPPSDGEGFASGGFIPEDDGGAFVPGRQDSFGSTLLATQKLRPRRSNEYGGGFVPEVEEEEEEDEEDEEGGFIRGLSPSEIGPSSRQKDLEGGFLPDAPLAEYEDATGALDSADVANIDKGDFIRNDATTQTVTKESIQKEVDMDPVTKTTANEESIARKLEETLEESPVSSSTSDAGSLPLEDPEDEDADPDWLVEAT